jgi:uncharacterized RDD family membrane protein YckC
MNVAATPSLQTSATLEPRTRELVTPEGIDLRLVLAEASERMTAFLLDSGIMIGSLIVLTLVLALATWVAGSARILREGIPVIWLLAFFFLRNFYFMAFELSPRAATPGKRLLGLRVAMRDGGPLTAEAVFARNALRELEIFLPLTILAVSGKSLDGWVVLLGLGWCAAFVFFPLLNRDRLRIGDLVGGTWVVRVPRRDLTIDLAETRADSRLQFSEAALNAYGIKELRVLEDVLRRRDPETVTAVAARIRGKIAMTAQEPDVEFLSAYYTALRGRLESRLLFGRRRRDKHDRE